MASLRLGAAFFAFGMIVMVVALFLTPLIGTAATDAKASVSVADGESQQINDNLEIEVQIDNKDNVTITVRDLTNYEQNVSQNFAPGDNTTVTVSGEEIFFEYREYVDSNSEAVIDVTYPPTFGFGETTRLFYENLDTILSMVALIIMLAGIFLGVRSIA